MEVTVGDDSVLHAERADRGKFADRHGRVFIGELQELTERDTDRLRRPTRRRRRRGRGLPNTDAAARGGAHRSVQKPRPP